MADVLPGARAALTPDGQPATPQYYRFFARLGNSAGGASAADIAALQAQLNALQAEIDALPSGNYPTLQAESPLILQGLLQNGFAKILWNGTTSDVPEGTSNLYFTDARAASAAMTPTVIASGETFTVPDATQCVWVVPITVDGDLVLDGDLAEAA